MRSKLSQEKKEGAAPKRGLEDKRNKMEPHPDTRIVTE
jgi:hypothetical protein